MQERKDKKEVKINSVNAQPPKRAQKPADAKPVQKVV